MEIKSNPQNLKSAHGPPMRYRLLAIDIDGTLVNSRDEISPATREALGRARAAGIHVVLATGRRYSKALPLVESLGIRVPLVTASGALVKDPCDHRTLFCAQFDRAVLCQALRIIAGCGFDPVVCADTFLEGFDFYMARPEARGPALAEYFSANRGDGRVWPGLLTCPPAGVFIGFSMGSREEMLALAELLDRRLPNRLRLHVLRSPKYSGFLCEWTPAGVTKWSAVRRLAQGWGIDDGQICAVGDDVNDIPMIQAAGLGVAMGNATAEVKAAADRLAPTLQEDGLATVVDWLLG
jgi:hypothetical protein